MTFDRDEQFLHEKLSADLHPAPVDLWPAVAENLPAKPHRRHLWLCLAAPLLIAAGVAATGAQFTDLRTNPRPSFAPEWPYFLRRSNCFLPATALPKPRSCTRRGRVFPLRNGYRE